MLFPFFRRHIFFHIVAENNQSDFVVILDRRKRQHGAYFRGNFTLHLLDGSEFARRTDIDQQHDSQFTFFLEHLDIGMPHPRGHFPVDGAHIIAVLILANLGKLHPSSLEHRMVFAGKHIVYQTPGLNLDSLDFFDNFLGDHLELLPMNQGTSMRLMIRATSSSLVISSASAS